MATAPFVVDITEPGDADIANQFPAQYRARQEVIRDYIGTEHDTSGHHKIPVVTEIVRDATSDWVVGSLVFNTDEDQLEIVTGTGPFVFTPAIESVITTGTWTPVLKFGGASVGIGYTTQIGRYIKIQNWVTIVGSIVLNNKGSSTGFATIGGLPFAPAATGQAYAGALTNLFGIQGLGTSDTNIAIGLRSIDTEAAFQAYAIDFDTTFPFSEGNFTNTTGFDFTLSYETA